MAAIPFATHSLSCSECGLTSRDLNLLANHSCDVQQHGGRCEDFPCCGHESGDCNGLLYGSDEAIKAEVYRKFDTGHGYCEHEAGIYQCDDQWEDDECPGFDPCPDTPEFCSICSCPEDEH